MLYGKVDYIYGWKAWDEHNGFPAAQGMLNVIETAGYLGYLWILWRHGEGEGYGRRTLAGGWGGFACLFGFALGVMTVSKTVLYGESERRTQLARPFKNVLIHGYYEADSYTRPE